MEIFSRLAWVLWEGFRLPFQGFAEIKGFMGFARAKLSAQLLPTPASVIVTAGMWRVVGAAGVEDVKFADCRVNVWVLGFAGLGFTADGVEVSSIAILGSDMTSQASTRSERCCRSKEPMPCTLSRMGCRAEAERTT